MNIFILLYILCLSGCLFVCLQPIQVETAEPIGFNVFFVGPNMKQGKIYEILKLEKKCAKKENPAKIKNKKF